MAKAGTHRSRHRYHRRNHDDTAPHVVKKSHQPRTAADRMEASLGQRRDACQGSHRLRAVHALPVIGLARPTTFRLDAAPINSPMCVPVSASNTAAHRDATADGLRAALA